MMPKHSLWTQYTNTLNSTTRLLFADYSSTFDTLQAYILAEKLSSRFHLDDRLILWITDLMTNRSQRVLVNNKFHDVSVSSTVCFKIIGQPVRALSIACEQQTMRTVCKILQDPSHALFLVFKWSPFRTLAQRSGATCSKGCSAQVVFETCCTPVVPQFKTVNVNNFVLAERTIWQGIEAELAIKKNIFFIHFCSGRFVSA